MPVLGSIFIGPSQVKTEDMFAAEQTLNYPIVAFFFQSFVASLNPTV
jgi:hypothetical protein